MSRRQFTPGGVYHVFNRGVEKRDIFVNDRDRWRFLQGMYLFNEVGSSSNLLWELERENKGMHFGILREFMNTKKGKRKPLVKVMADCLMPNHFHLLLEEVKEGGVSKFMQRLGGGYTRYFNARHERVGSLFQGTFKAVEVDSDEYLKHLLVYINALNPGQLLYPELKKEGVWDVQGVMQYAEEYPWSTHKEYLGKRESEIVEKGRAGKLFGSPGRYETFVGDVLEGRKPFDWESSSLLA